MRKLAFILYLLAATSLALADETNYFCILCGKGPLTGHFWMSKWGPICNDCYHLENHCSICGLPIDKDYAKTGDGRYICKFCKTNAVLDVEEAREVFAEVRSDLVELFGSSYVLQYPDVTVNLFDVDYWSEAGRSDGLHKYGFAHTRKTPKGNCTHEVVLLSGRLRVEMSAVAAHEYTHLWLNENRPASHEIDSDTIEGICELAAYKLMESRSEKEEEQQILENPYTHGAIKKLVAIEQEHGVAYILNWVKNGSTPTLDTEENTLAAPVKTPVLVAYTNVPPPLPETVKLNGLMLDGRTSHAIISGVSFASGETKQVPLRNGPVQVKCEAIHRSDVVLEVEGINGPVSLGIGEEKSVP